MNTTATTALRSRAIQLGTFGLAALGSFAAWRTSFAPPAPATVANPSIGTPSTQQTDWEYLQMKVKAIDTLKTRKTLDQIDAQWKQCFLNGMEPNAAGLHLLAPNAITHAGGTYFPRVGDYTWSHDWAFWEVDGQEHIEYFKSGDFRNRPIDGSRNTAAVSLSRAFGNGIASYSIVAEAAGLSGIDATFATRAVTLLRNTYEYAEPNYSARGPHYAPRAGLALVTREQLYAAATARLAAGARVAVLAPEEVASPAGAVRFAVAGDSAAYARALYATLHEVDALGLDVVLAVAPPLEGLGLAVLDRLRRASAPRSGGDEASPT